MQRAHSLVGRTCDCFDLGQAHLNLIHACGVIDPLRNTYNAWGAEPQRAIIRIIGCSIGSRFSNPASIGKTNITGIDVKLHTLDYIGCLVT